MTTKTKEKPISKHKKRVTQVLLATALVLYLYAMHKKDTETADAAEATAIGAELWEHSIIL